MTSTALLVTSASPALTPFMGGHEGFVSVAYICPGGVLTIGYGFTMRSAVFAAYWRKARGRALQPGDTISRAEADMLLLKLINEEYAPPVARAIKTFVQHQFDGATSPSYNCGPNALKWKWALALARGDVKEAARLLRVTATTANGRTLPGLIRRRKEEGDLIEFGRYAQHKLADASISTEPEDVRWYQTQLAALGFYDGPINGVVISSEVAVRAYQAARKLKVDGIVGPATRATIIRDLDAKLQNRSAGGGAIVGGSGEAVLDTTGTITNAPPATDAPQGTSSPEIGADLPQPPPEALPSPDVPLPVEFASDVNLLAVAGVAIAVAGVVWIGFWVWRNRRRFFGGGRVPT